ncbi:hypothetical protein MOQ72_26490 [Saccharopolyspora sp. K220]|uniref:MmyB family transcriptional regulator n=1 Tax=Saccharopolyspora soli TaxID=2926618 RepID=UPI001F572A92|nr:hypothetical protein [Saccharopolyspora soli]MCI2420997.1 hypothetical protein [Saccharopolyspora soli]
MRSAFLDPEVRALYGDDWERIAAGSVSAIRALAGPESRDPQLAELVGELSVRSEEFRQLWVRHDVAPRTGGSTDGLVLVLFHAAPGSAAAQSLALLAHLATTTPLRRRCPRTTTSCAGECHGPGRTSRPGPI